MQRPRCSIKPPNTLRSNSPILRSGSILILANPYSSLDVCCVDSLRDRKGAIIVSPHQGEKDGPTQPYPTPPPHGRGPHGALLPHRRCLLRPSQPPARSYESIKRLSDSQVIALALFQQLRGVESERSLSWATPRGSSPTSCSPGW